MASDSTSVKLINELVIAVYGAPGTANDMRARYALTQALHALTRLSRSEQLMEMQRDAARAAGAHSRREMHTALRRIAGRAAAGQGQLPLALSAGDGAVP
jgi:hypothetical protein